MQGRGRRGGRGHATQTTCQGIERGSLVELADRWGDAAEVGGFGGEGGEVFDQSANAGLYDLKVMLAGVVEEEVFADLPRVADWAVEPCVFLQEETSSGELNPALGHPVA